MRYILIVISFIACLACSNDDDVVTSEVDVGFSSFSALTLDEDFFYELQFNGNSQSATERNLTLSDNIFRAVEFIHEQEGVLGFYRERMVWIRDFKEGQTSLYTDFVSPGNSERREGVVNDDTYIALLYRFPDSLDELRLRLINYKNNVIVNISLGNVAQEGEAYIKDGTVVVITQNNDDAKLFIINAADGAILKEEFFANTLFLGQAFGTENDFYLFDNQNNSYRYDLSSYEMLSTRSSQFLAFPGAVYEVHGTKIYSDFAYSQPSVFISGPQIYDLATDEIERIDLQQAFNNYAAINNLDGDLRNTDFTYDVNTDTWLCNYVLSNETSESYGVLKMTNDAEITGAVETEHFVSRFLRVEER